MSVFVPPFCPNRFCLYHEPSGAYSHFISWGSYPTRTFGTVPRFKCLACGKTFSRQTFSLDYYAKRLLDYEVIARRLASCESLSAIGRAHHASTDSISNRISRAARQTLAFESQLADNRHPNEDLTADGFESFCVSQYFPNNITILVGKNSQFLYAADHASLRRKGRMTKVQRKRRDIFDTVFKPPARAIESSFTEIALESLRVMQDGGRSPLVLWTDQHRAYRRALKEQPHLARLIETGKLIHRTVSSRRERTLHNPLFPVNYLDREIRKDLHEHVRETVCFGRNVNRQMERFALYLFWHNYRKAHRVRGAPQSHAEFAGYDARRIEGGLGTIWRKRAWLSLIEVAVWMEKIWRRLYKTPLGKRRDYLPAYALG